MKKAMLHWRNWLIEPVAPTSKIWRYGLWFIIGVFALTTLAQSIAVPVFEGADEQRHYAYARYLVNHFSLPLRVKPAQDFYATYDVAQESGQPPLYYIPVALITALVPNADAIGPYVVYNPFVSPSDDAGLPLDNHNLYLHGTEGRFPFQGVALAVHLGRLVSVVIGMLTLLSVYAVGRVLTPARPAVALLATLLVASVPGFTFVYSTITNDTAVVLFVTLSLWSAVRIIREGPGVRLVALGSLFAGLAVLSKINGAWAIGIVWFALLASVVLHHKEQPLKAVLPILLLSAGVWLAVTGWWFVFGLVHGNDPLGIAIHAISPAQSPLNIGNKTRYDIIASLGLWELTTWYSAGWARVFGPDWLYQTFTDLYLLGLVGAIGLSLHTVIRWFIKRRDLRVEVAQISCLLLVALLAIAGGLYWQVIYNWTFGRLLYPGLTSVALIAAAGWVWWLGWVHRLRLPYALNWVAAVVLVIIPQRATLWAANNTIMALTPHAMTTQIPADVTRTQVTFLDPADRHTPVAELIGYRLHPQDLHPGNAMYVDLCWKSVGYTRENFPYSLQLVGPNDTRPGTRNSFHGLGSYPLNAWKSGEEFCDETSVLVSFAADQPRAYHLVVTLFELQQPNDRPGPPLPAVDGNGRSVYPVIGRARVTTGTQPIVTPTVNLGDLAGLVDTTVALSGTNALSVTLRWVALSATDVDAKVFMHVIDKTSGQVIAQDDHQPDGGWFPTNYWQKGDVIDDQFEIPLPPDTNLHNAELQVGLYNAQSQERLPAVNIASQERYTDDIVPIPMTVIGLRQGEVGHLR
jgi:4-amino-4-deoxy-L-arabinose transferase-like glycosyltransferase